MNQREKIIARIKALQAKTISRGATEAEAEAATRKAAELMAEYQIATGDVAASEYGWMSLAIKGVRTGSVRQSHPCVFAANGVQHISGAKLYLSSKDGLIAIGDEASLGIAAYLFDLIYTAINAAWKAERKLRVEKSRALWRQHVGPNSVPKRFAKEWHDDLRDWGIAHDRKAQQTFGAVMASRMAERMQAMPPARPVPEEIIKSITGGTKVKSTSGLGSDEVDHSVFEAGRRAGDAVQISMGVGRNTPQRRIG